MLENSVRNVCVCVSDEDANTRGTSRKCALGRGRGAKLEKRASDSPAVICVPRHISVDKRSIVPCFVWGARLPPSSCGASARAPSRKPHQVMFESWEGDTSMGHEVSIRENIPCG